MQIGFGEAVLGYRALVSVRAAMRRRDPIGWVGVLHRKILAGDCPIAWPECFIAVQLLTTRGVELGPEELVSRSIVIGYGRLAGCCRRVSNQVSPGTRAIVNRPSAKASPSASNSA